MAKLTAYKTLPTETYTLDRTYVTCYLQPLKGGVEGTVKGTNGEPLRHVVLEPGDTVEFTEPEIDRLNSRGIFSKGGVTERESFDWSVLSSTDVEELTELLTSKGVKQLGRAMLHEIENENREPFIAEIGKALVSAGG